jgi:SSS family solute:Na+ symporter
VFLLTVFWKRTTKKAVNGILSFGSAFSLFIGVLYLWIFPANEYPVWPHFLLLSFYIFAFLFVVAILISLLDPNPITNLQDNTQPLPTTSKQVKIGFALLGMVIVCLYIIFNGH